MSDKIENSSVGNWQAKKNAEGSWDVTNGWQTISCIHEDIAIKRAIGLNIADSTVDWNNLVKLVPALEWEARVSRDEGWPNGAIESALSIVRPITNIISGSQQPTEDSAT